MTLKNARWLWGVVALQVVFLVGWAGYHETVRRNAPTIRLKTLPVDPRDILRGDYMTLNYEISRPVQAVTGAGPLEGEVFVVLKPEGAHHVIAEILIEEPPANDPRLWVSAKAWGAADNPRLDFGIERFFVPEGKGTPTFATLEVEASVSATHHLYIRRLWLDGERFP